MDTPEPGNRRHLSRTLDWEWVKRNKVGLIVVALLIAAWLTMGTIYDALGL
jgi:hypothetical protein